MLNNQGSAVLQVRGPFTLTLSLSPSVALTGTKTSTTSSGNASFSSMSIATPGNYVLTVSNTGMISGDFSITIIALAVSSMTISISPNPVSAYFNFDVTVTLLDQQNRLFTSASTIDLNIGTNFIGTITKSTSTGSAVFSLYSKVSGLYTIQAVCSSVSISSTINILQNLIKVVSVSPTVITMQTMYVGDSFNLAASVYDSSGLNLASSGTFPLTLSLSPSSTLNGITSKSTTSAAAQFSGLQIQNSGSFIVIVSSLDTVSGSSVTLTVLDLSLNSIILETSNLSPTIFFEFTLTVTLKDQKGQLWTQSTNVNLVFNSGIAGEVSKAVVGGTGIFLVYCTASGTIAVKANSGVDSNVVSLNALKGRIKISNLNPVVSFM